MSRRALLLTAMLCLGSAGCATQPHFAPEAWTLVHSEPTMAYYLDKGSVRLQGRYLTYWILVNFNYDPKFDGAEPYKSAQLLRYANCATREQDTKTLLQYHAPMGRGEPTWALTFEDDSMRMEPAEPGSVAAQLLEVACSVKN